MEDRRTSGNFRQLNKKKIVVLGIVIVLILLVLLIIIGVVVVAIIAAISGQSDGNIGRSISDIGSTIWKAALDFLQSLWNQVIADPIKFLTGGSN